MACSSCNTDPCNCSSSNCPTCSCSDPGSVAYGRYLSVLDYAFCEKRLEAATVNGILAVAITGSGDNVLTLTNNPCFAPDTYTVVEGGTISTLGAFLGDNSCLRRAIPDAATNGMVITALNGEWVLQALPETTVPDPLTLANLVVTEDITVNNVQVTGGFCMTNVASGTVTTAIGLNASGCIVQQSSGSTPAFASSMAMYFEAPTESSVSHPNVTTGDGGYAIIGNELSDKDNIAQVQDVYTIKINVAGEYRVDWAAFVDLVGVTATQFRANLTLEINGGTTLVPGNGPTYATSSGARVEPAITGTTIKTFAANDVLKLLITKSNVGGGSPSGGARFAGIKLLLTKYQSA